MHETLQQAIEAAQRETAAISAIVNSDEKVRSALGWGAAYDRLVAQGAGEPVNIVTPSGGKPKEGEKVDLRIDGFIGYFEVSDIRNILAAKTKPKEITLRLSTPGGSVWSGYAIYQLLRQAAQEGAKVTTVAAGRVASAGALIFMAGDHRVMPKNLATIMFHRSMTLFITGAFGNVEELEKLDPAKDLELAIGPLKSIDDAIAEMLADRSKMSKPKAAKYLEKEAYENPKEALRLGFATEITEDTPPGDKLAKDKQDTDPEPEPGTVDEPRVVAPDYFSYAAGLASE